MALCKQQIDARGVTTTYHKVAHVSLSDSRLMCILESYVSKDYRLAEQSAESNSYHFEITVEEEESMGIRALCYSKLKELEEWAGAEDC